MYRVVDGAQRVVLLDAPAEAFHFNANTDTINHPLPTHSSSLLLCPVVQNSEKTRFILPSESDPPDVVIHSDMCAVALHLSVLRQRCPWFYKQLRQLRHSPLMANGFKLLNETELQHLQDNPKDRTRCPLHDPHSLRLDYVRCVAHKCQIGSNGDDRTRGRFHQQDRAVVRSPQRKRLRQMDDKSLLSEKCVALTSRHTRSSSGTLDFVPKIGLEEELEHQRGVMHVKIEGTNIGAVVTAVEYIYRCEVRMINERNAMEAVKLGQKLGLGSTMLYYPLVIAVRHVTTATWIDILLTVSMLENEIERRILCDHLVAFLASLKPEQYYQALTDMRCVYIRELEDRDVLICALVGLINNIRLVEFWQNLLNALSYWLSYRFCSEEVPSLRAIHRHFAPEWEPYMERDPVDFHVKPGEEILSTLLQFGKYQLQVRVDIMNKMPISWRVIRSSSPQPLTSDPDEIDDPVSFGDDPGFWIRGQVKIEYWREQPNHAMIKQEVELQYQHCYEQYSKWRGLEPLTSKLASTFRTAVLQPGCMGKVQFCGNFFVWGNPVCSVYHFLLQSTLFYSAPYGSPTEISDLVIVSEMQRLPLETLELVLRSDGLRIPDGERTLLRCLNKLFFGSNFSYCWSSATQTCQKYNCCPEDMVRLYGCVRWCFVPIDDVIDTLRQSPRKLMLYESIETGLRDTFRRFLRRRPWGWCKHRRAYMKNKTNAVEFRIKASENQLSPEYFPVVLTASS